MHDERWPPPDDNGGALAPREWYSEFADEFGPRKHLRDHWRAIARRKWVVLTLVVTALAVSTVYTFLEDTNGQECPCYKRRSALDVRS